MLEKFGAARPAVPPQQGPDRRPRAIATNVLMRRILDRCVGRLGLAAIVILDTAILAVYAAGLWAVHLLATTLLGHGGYGIWLLRLLEAISFAGLAGMVMVFAWRDVVEELALTSEAVQSPATNSERVMDRQD